MEKYLEETAQDYGRFSLLFLALGLFLLIGFLLPTGYRVDLQAQPEYVLIILSTLIVASICRWLAFRAKQACEKLNE